MQNRPLCCLAAALAIFLAGSNSTCGGAAQGADAAATSPVIQLDRKEIDAGEVFRGQPARFVFQLQNTGRSPLTIKARTTCGCTVAKCDELIPPGQTGKIEAELKTSGLGVGPASKGIIVTTNDPTQKTIHLNLKAEIVPAVRLVGRGLSLIALQTETPTVREVLVEARGPESFEITGATFHADYATATIDPVPASGDDLRFYRLRLTIQPSAPTGRHSLTALLATTSKSEPTSLLTFVCEKGILTTPSTVVLLRDKANPTGPASGNVKLLRREGTFQITKVDAGDLDVQVRTMTLREGQEYQVVVTSGSLPTPSARPRKRHSLRIETDDPTQPSITVPLWLPSVASQPQATAAE
jgi:Protein of unknown function (DUF1573)